jgi:molybdopterin-guanine dinucleotide biosynthesis protein
MDSKKFEKTLEQLTRTQQDVLKLFLSNLDDQGVAQSLRIGSADTVRQHIKNIADKFDIPSDISDKNFRRREMVKLFRQYSPESVSAKHKHDENWSVFSEGSDRPQPPTNPQNISTARVNDNSHIPSDQEELETDSSISSWVSEKSYNKFIARDFDLKKLIEYTENGISSKVLSIWGMGGLGKTATCHRLISLLCHQKRFKKIVWINAKRKQFQTSEGKSEQIRESRLDIQDAILDIGKELNLDAWFVQDIDRLQHEISKLFMQESHLLIIDGLEDAESPKLLISHLRRILGKSSLFLTSRKQISLENGFEYRLSELDRQSSYTFIQQMILEKCADDQAIGQQISQNIEKVITATHGMPLAMKLLVSQAKFLGLERVLERLNSVIEEEDFYSYLYWEVYEELCKGNQIEVLKILIFLSNQSSLSTPLSWLYDFDDMNKKEIDDAIKIMYRLSLIEVSNYDKEDRQINLHSFTAQYFRETLKTKLS